MQINISSSAVILMYCQRKKSNWISSFLLEVGSYDTEPQPRQASVQMKLPRIPSRKPRKDGSVPRLCGLPLVSFCRFCHFFIELGPLSWPGAHQFS